MKYPKTIKIGKAVYKVKLVKHIHETKRRIQKGECDPNTHTIRLLKSLDRVELFETFVHELLHAIEFEHKIKIKHKTVYELEKPLAALIKSLARRM